MSTDSHSDTKTRGLPASMPPPRAGCEAATRKNNLKTSSASNLEVTVGVICYQEKEKLALTLNSLVMQTAFQQIKEVLLVHNGTCRRTLNCAKSFSNKLPLTVLPHPENHIGKARDLLIRRASCPLAAFIDGDCTAPPDWLERFLFHWSRLASLQPSGVGGPNRAPENRVWQKIFNLSVSHFMGHGRSPQAWRPKKAAPVSHLPTSNALFSVEKIRRAGGFSEKRAACGEDLELGLRLQKTGPLYLLPDPAVLNDFAASYSQSLRRLFRFGRAQRIKGNRRFWPALLFAPGFAAAGAAGFYHSLCLLLLWVYFAGLVFAAGQVFMKSRSFLAAWLPFVWFLHHLTYSLGALSSLFSRSD